MKPTDRPFSTILLISLAGPLLLLTSAPSTAHASTERRVYLCNGARAAAIVLGHQVLDCFQVGGDRALRVGFSSGSDPRDTGLTAESYLGINVGLTVTGGLLIHDCERTECENLRPGRATALRGGSGSAGFGLGLGGAHFEWPGHRFQFAFVHLGVLFEASLSALTIEVTSPR